MFKGGRGTRLIQNYRRYQYVHRFEIFKVKVPIIFLYSGFLATQGRMLLGLKRISAHAFLAGARGEGVDRAVADWSARPKKAMRGCMFQGGLDWSL